MTKASLSVVANKIITINAAKESGLKRYFTGRPCKHGHIAERLVVGSTCMECARIKDRRHYRANLENMRNKNLKFRDDHPEYMREYRKGWALKNRHYPKQWLSQDPERRVRLVEYQAKWRHENKFRLRVYGHTRRARELSGGRLSPGLKDKLFKLQRGKCACCKKNITKGFHIDHIHSLAKGGANEDWNIQLLCPGCNMSKSAKHPIDFMQEHGFLL